MREGGEDAALLRAFDALGNPTRLALLDRLARPAFMADLVEELGVTRQTLDRHIEALLEAGLIRAMEGQRGFLRAQQYVVDPAGLFTFKETVRALAAPRAALLLDAPTRDAPAPEGAPGAHGYGLLLLHGDEPGRWYPLATGASVLIGRAADADVPLAYDIYASAKHARLAHARGVWSVTDLESHNGTLVNLRPLPAGGTQTVRHGDVLTVGRTLLLLRQGA